MGDSDGAELWVSGVMGVVCVLCVLCVLGVECCVLCAVCCMLCTHPYPPYPYLPIYSALAAQLKERVDWLLETLLKFRPGDAMPKELQLLKGCMRETEVSAVVLLCVCFVLCAVRCVLGVVCYVLCDHPH